MKTTFFSKIYVSQESYPFGESELRDLSELSQEMNARFGISGYLVYLDGLFVQYFEGASAPVEQLMFNIRNDARHTVLEEAGESDLVSRRFPRWFMRWLHTAELAQVQLERDLAKLLQSRKTMDAAIWMVKLWLTVERVVALDKQLQEQETR